MGKVIRTEAGNNTRTSRIRSFLCISITFVIGDHSYCSKFSLPLLLTIAKKACSLCLPKSDWAVHTSCLLELHRRHLQYLCFTTPNYVWKDLSLSQCFFFLQNCITIYGNLIFPVTLVLFKRKF